MNENQQQINKLNKLIIELSGKPDPAGIYRQIIAKAQAQVYELQNQSQPNPEDYFSPNFINKQFDLAGMNLSRRAGNTANIATMNAGAQASSLGLVNKGGFTTGVASNVRQSFIPEFAKLDIGRNIALQGNQQNLFSALNSMFQSDRASSGQVAGMAANNQQYWDNQAGGMDWLKAALPLAGLALPGGGSIGGAILYPSQYT